MNNYYFSHDSNSRKDPKISALIAKHGIIGYGLYWMLIEIFHEQGGTLTKFPVLYEGLASQLNIDCEQFIEIFRYMIDKCQLFEEDESKIWNNRVIRNLEELNRKRLSKAEAGKIGGIRSGEARSKIKQCFEANEANEANKIKVNKIKLNNIKDIDSYIDFRKIEFTKYPDNFINRLLSDFFITQPIVYSTDKINDQYKDFVDIIYQATTDNDWIMQISRDTDKSKIRHKLTDFINYCLTSQCFRTEKYLNHYEFQKHFVNKYLRK
jgi:hypothetical protein